MKGKLIECYEVVVVKDGKYVSWNGHLYESEHAADTARGIARKKYGKDTELVILTKYLHLKVRA